jgi:hypothetical protein
MSQNRELVRASDIGLWAYCHRAWWLARVQGAPHKNPQQLAHGVEMHAEHGAQLTHAQRLQRVGVWLVLLGFMTLLAFLALPRLFG